MSWLERHAIRQNVTWMLLILFGSIVITSLLAIPYILLGGKPGWFPFCIGIVAGIIWGRVCAQYSLRVKAKFPNSNLE